MKTCTKCKKHKSFDEFYPDKKAKDGKKSHCAQCCRDYAKAYNLEHSDERKAYMATWRAENEEVVLEAHRIRSAKARADNPDAVRSSQMKTMYGITLADYDQMLANQDGQCASPACNNEPTEKQRLSIDHDHDHCPDRAKSCGECLRGLLCSPCNFALGQIRDDSIKLRGLAAYLRNPPTYSGEHPIDPDIWNAVEEWSASSAQGKHNMYRSHRLRLEDYARMLSEQRGTCANPACSNVHTTERRFDIDHDHACCDGSKSCPNCIRGLLCKGCNAASGCVGDDPIKILGLADYLESYALINQ